MPNTENRDSMIQEMTNRINPRELQEILLLEKPELNQEQQAMIRFLRRERISRPAVFLDVTSPSVIYGIDQFKVAVKEWGENNALDVDVVETGSLGLISAEPVIGIQIPGRARLYYGQITPLKLPSILDAVVRQVVPEENLIGQMLMASQQPWEGIPFWDQHPFFKGQTRYLMNLCGVIDPCSASEYIAWGGYQAFAKSLRYYTSQELLKLIEESNLRGRSGSGFLAATKWLKVANTPSDKRYVLCNADESDPGGYMHRILMESNPHLIIEGIMLAAYITGSGQAIIYTRSRYPMAVKRLQKALQEARSAGLLGSDILKSGFSLDIQLKRGPGAYVCGEETAILSSLEGKRGMPQNRPPYPATQGLFGKPTLVHNVETLAQVPLIIRNGPEWYKKTGTAESSGTKLFSLSGRISRLGVVEVPFGTPLKTLVNDFGGGVRNGQPLKALLFGGPSGKFVTATQIDTPIDFEHFEEEDLVMGSGSLVVLDEGCCPINLMKNLMDFNHQESCGKCIPCRDGTKRVLSILKSVTTRPANQEKFDALERFRGITRIEELAEVMKSTSLCGLGKTAANPVISGMKLFREEMEEHVFDRICRAGVCRNLRSFRIDPVNCTGCNICMIKCPENAIIGSPHKVHIIMEDICSGCGKCYEVCKFNAIRVL